MLYTPDPTSGLYQPDPMSGLYQPDPANGLCLSMGTSLPFVSEWRDGELWIKVFTNKDTTTYTTKGTTVPSNCACGD